MAQMGTLRVKQGDGPVSWGQGRVWIKAEYYRVRESRRADYTVTP